MQSTPKKLLVGLGVLALYSLMVVPTFAQAAGWLPGPLNDLFGDNAFNFFQNRVQVGGGLTIGGLLISGVIFAIPQVIKLQKDGKDAISGASEHFQGLAMSYGWLFLIPAAIYFIASFLFGGISTPQKICLEAPDSIGCYACQNPESGSPMANSTKNTAEELCEVCNRNVKIDACRTSIIDGTQPTTGNTQNYNLNIDGTDFNIEINLN